MENKLTQENQEIIQKLGNAKTDLEFKDVLDNHFPGWFITSFDNYSKDYPHFQNNWEYICGQLGVKPKKIILVDAIDFDNEKSALINAVYEYCTRQGYIIRRQGEFIGCSVCYSAIPSKEIYPLLKEKKFIIPKVWSDRCVSCK